jgi:hypothetical protein
MPHHRQYKQAILDSQEVFFSKPYCFTASVSTGQSSVRNKLTGKPALLNKFDMVALLKPKRTAHLRYIKKPPG